MEILIIIFICFILLWLILKSPESNQSNYQNSYKPKINESETIVLIRFLDIPEESFFRYRNTWWKKRNFKSARSEVGGEIEVDAEAPVGALLKDIPKNKRINILNI